jgi:hypothetical protein
MDLSTRRAFHHRFLGSLMAYGLIDTLFYGDLLAGRTARPVQPVRNSGHGTE